MERDASSFVNAVVAEGFTRDEAVGAAEMIVREESLRDPAYPYTISMMLGFETCRVTADVEGNTLVLRRCVRTDWSAA
jgi:hypothetical protein